MHAPRANALAGLAGLAGLALLAASAMPAAAASATAGSRSGPQIHLATSGHAYGTRVQLASLTGSGKSALTEVGCGAVNALKRNATTHVNLSGLGQVHAVRTWSRTSRDAAGIERTKTRARTAGVSLLGGMIQLRALTSTAIARQRLHARPTGRVRFLGLQIGGKPMTSDPKPNTSLRIPGIATLTINAQRRTAAAGVRRLQVDALELTLLRGSGFGPAGTTVRVGHSAAAVHRLVSTPLRGASSGSEIHVGALATSAPTFQTKIPCAGVADQTAAHRGAGVNLSKLLKTGVIRTRAHGHTGFSPTSSTRATVAKVNLLGGAVTAAALRAQATVTSQAGQLIKNNLGSHFVGLKINGKPMNDNISPNTRISLLGIGTLWLDRQIMTAHGIEIHMIELVLGQATDGYAKGTVIDVANAKAAVRH